MSMFKRLSNVARGKMLELGKNIGEIDPFGPDAPPAPRRASRGESSEPVSTAEPPKDKRAILLGLKQEGLLTEDEYQDKLAALEASEATKDSGDGPRRPMKRHL